jgi:acylphosphatase
MPSESGVQVLISGHVQGVGFRFYARRHALALSLRGHARNLEDGRVEVVAEGPQDALEAFVERLREGPAGSHVRDCVVAWTDAPVAPAGFTIS